MTRTVERQRIFVTCLFLVAVFAVSITPIQSYDYFWHLAAGNWILDQGKLPETDPFSVSSDAIPWIDGEWLFQMAAAVVDRVGGSTATSIVRGVCVALIFSIGFAALLRRVEPAAALFVSIVSVWGADHRLTTRPETVATLFLVVALWILFEWKPGIRAVAVYALLTVVWMANHPSALLAPAVAGLVLAGRFMGGDRGPELGWRTGIVAASGFALLVNPWGLEGVLAPLRLASLVGSGAFVNIEWTPTTFADFPLVYLSAAALVALFLWKRDWKEEAARLLLFAFFAALAFRYVRNHGFFFAALPFIVSSRIPAELPARVRRAFAVATAALFVGLIWQHQGIRTGVDDDQFPVASVSYLRGLGLDGNIYNPDQLGGYLIWSFYPERRVLTDGRNELHVSYIDEYSKARLDQREWNALLDRYGIALAVDEYHRETMDVVDAVTGDRRRMPASLIYFPRSKWALIGFDDVAMVFARREAFDAGLIDRIEFRALVPDGPVPVMEVSSETLTLARMEIERAKAQFGEQDSIERIERLLGVPQAAGAREAGSR
jgi:hypothetical protein